MIRARELRRGNLVRCIMHLPIGFHRPALAYSEIIELREGVVETTEGVYKYRNIAPLKLTEEILIKSGGIKNEENEFVFATHEKLIPELKITTEHTLYYISLGNNVKFGVPFDSVHHFQNLYYFLVGSEIKIKI